MAIEAKWRVTTGEKTYQRGEIIVGLSAEDEKELLEAGAICLIYRESVRPDIAALTAVLKGTAKAGLLTLANKSGVAVNEKDKVGAIIEAITADASKNGVDLESLTDQQLQKFAVEAGIAVQADDSREDVLTAVEKVFESV